MSMLSFINASSCLLSADNADSPGTSLCMLAAWQLRPLMAPLEQLQRAPWQGIDRGALPITKRP